MFRRERPAQPKPRAPASQGHPSRGGKTVGGGTKSKPVVYRSPTPSVRTQRIEQADRTVVPDASRARHRSRVANTFTRRLAEDVARTSRIEAAVRRSIAHPRVDVDLYQHQAERHKREAAQKQKQHARRQVVLQGTYRPNTDTVRRARRKAKRDRFTLPRHFQADSATAGRVTIMLPAYQGAKKHKRTFRDEQVRFDGKTETLPALEQATAAKRRRIIARRKYQRELGKQLASTKLADKFVLHPKVIAATRRGGAEGAIKAQNKLVLAAAEKRARKVARKAEYSHAVLDTAAIAKYGTHYGSGRVKGTERYWKRKQEEQNAARPFLENVKRGAVDIVKSAPASAVMAAKAYGKAVPGMPGYIEARLRGESHAKAAHEHAPELQQYSAEFRDASALVALSKGDIEGAARKARGNPVAAAGEIAALVSPAMRVAGRIGKGGKAGQRARPDVKVRTPEATHGRRTTPRSRKQAGTRLRAERKAAKAQVLLGQRHSKAKIALERAERGVAKAKGKSADKQAKAQARHEAAKAQVERSPAPTSTRALGDRQQFYSVNPAVRAAQKGRETLKAKRGKDPFLLSAKKSGKRKGQATVRDLQHAHAASLKHEISTDAQVRQARRRAAGRGSKATKQARSDLLTMLASGLVRDGSVKSDLAKLAREADAETGPDGMLARTVRNIQQVHDRGDIDVHKIVPEKNKLVELDADIVGYLDRHGVLDAKAARQRALRQGPVGRGEAVHVREGEQLPTERSVAARGGTPREGTLPVERHAPRPRARGRELTPEQGRVRRASKREAKEAAAAHAQRERGRHEEQSKAHAAAVSATKAELTEARAGQRRAGGTSRKVPDEQGKMRASGKGAQLLKQRSSARAALAAARHRNRKEGTRESNKRVEDAKALLAEVDADVKASRAAQAVLEGRPHMSNRERAARRKEAEKHQKRIDELERRERAQELARPGTLPPHTHDIRSVKGEHGVGYVDAQGKVRSWRADSKTDMNDTAVAHRDGLDAKDRFEIRDNRIVGTHLTGLQIQDILRAIPGLEPPLEKPHLAVKVAERQPGKGSGTARDTVTQKGKEHTVRVVPRSELVIERIQKLESKQRELKKKGRKLSKDDQATLDQAYRDRTGQAKPSVKRETVAEAKPAAEPPKARHTGFYPPAAKHDTAAHGEVMGVRGTSPERKSDILDPGQPIRGTGWTGADIHRPDPKRDALLETFRENSRAAGQALKLDRFMAHSPGPMSLADAHAYVKKANSQGHDYTVFEMSDPLARALLRKSGMSEQQIKTVLAASEGMGTAIPTAVRKAWDADAKKAGRLSSASRLVTYQFLRATLPLSVMWQFGNLTDNALRAAVAGAGPEARRAFKDWEQAARAIDPRATDQIVALLQGHFGSRSGVVARPRLRDVFDADKGALQAALSELSTKVGDSAAYRGGTMPLNKLLDSAFDVGAKGEQMFVEMMMGKALIEGAKDMGQKQLDHVQLAHRMLKDPALAETFRRRTLEMVGDYTKNPAARMLSPIDPFWNWFKAANRFVFHTLPVKHPVKAGMMAAAAGWTAEERARLGLNYYYTDQEAEQMGLPEHGNGFMTGALPLGHGMVIPLMPFSSFGEAARLMPNLDEQGYKQLFQPTAELASRLLPFAQGPTGNLMGTQSDAGKEFAAQAFGMKSYISHTRRKDRLGEAGKSLLPSFVPGVKQAVQLRDQRVKGFKGNVVLNPFAARMDTLRPAKPRKGVGDRTLEQRKSGAFVLRTTKGKKVRFAPKVAKPRPTPTAGAGASYAGGGGGVSGGAPSGPYAGAVGGLRISAGGKILAGPAPGGQVATRGGGGAATVYDFFRDNGFTAAQAAGITGTLQKESNFSTSVLNKVGSGATGLAQWLGGRLTALKQRPNWQSLETQLNFIMHELKTTESAAYNSLKRARTPEEAARIFDGQFERSDNIGSAEAYARSHFQRFQGRPSQAPNFTGGRKPSLRASAANSKGGRTVVTPGVDNRRARTMMALDFLHGRMSMLDFVGQVSQLNDVAEQSVTTGGGRPSARVRRGGKGDPAFQIAKDGWKGSKTAGQALALATGLPVSSEKRGTVMTASGGVSDHYAGNKDSYAWDLATSGAAGTKVAKRMARALGIKNWQGGSWLSVNRKIEGRTYRFQLGWNVPDHYDHIHMGVDRVDIAG